MSVAVADRVLAIRRNTRLLTVAHTAMQMTFPVMLVVAGPAAKEITGRAGSVGLLSAVYFFAVGIGAVSIGRWMDRVGRRPGLLLSVVLGGAPGSGPPPRSPRTRSGCSCSRRCRSGSRAAERT